MIKVVGGFLKTFGMDGFMIGRLLKLLNWEARKRHFSGTKETDSWKKI